MQILTIIYSKKYIYIMIQDDIATQTHIHAHKIETKLLRKNSYPYNV